MTLPPNADGASAANASPAEKITATKQDPPQDTALASSLPQVWCVAVPPCGRRRLWLLWVPRCSHCSFAHVHRATGPVGGVRTAGCGRGSYYVRVQRTQGRVAA